MNSLPASKPFQTIFQHICHDKNRTVVKLWYSDRSETYYIDAHGKSAETQRGSTSNPTIAKIIFDAIVAEIEEK